MKTKRASGILLHITSLPVPFGIGDFGPAAYRFADFLARSGQSYWQILPLNPPTMDSPYSTLSAFAGNPLLISPELLYHDGLLTKKQPGPERSLPETYVDFAGVISYKTKLLNFAYEQFRDMPTDPHYEFFCERNKYWLDDYATFIAFGRHFGTGQWNNWPKPLRDRNKNAIDDITQRLCDDINREKFLQYLFFKQWSALKYYCNQRGIKIIGDIPIYLVFDSADVWSNPGIFKLTKAKSPFVVSGTPPDYFSKTGQLWRTPVYDWPVLKKTGYKWWFQRIKHNLKLFDVVRLDHFRAFVAYWQVPAHHKTAAKGKWVKAPGSDFFKKLFKQIPNCPIVAEDLGHITDDVTALIEKFHLPGMRIIQYAFDGDPEQNSHHPANHIKNCIVYTGTHDNNTIKGWFTNEATRQQKKNLFRYLGQKIPTSKIHWRLIQLAFDSVANTAIIPMQDVLGLDEKARMNRPAAMKANWSWRLTKNQITPEITTRLRNLTKIYGRG